MIDRQKLATAVRTRRADQSLRAASSESGVPFTTIKRVEHEESEPDLHNFIRLCLWMRMQMNFFVVVPDEDGASQEEAAREAVAT